MRGNGTMKRDISTSLFYRAMPFAFIHNVNPATPRGAQVPRPGTRQRAVALTLVRRSGLRGPGVLGHRRLYAIICLRQRH